MSVKLLVLYPTPKDPEEFNRRYEREHLPMGKASLVGATGLASHRILGSPAGQSPFARLTEITFPTLRAVQETAALPGAPIFTVDTLDASGIGVDPRDRIGAHFNACADIELHDHISRRAGRDHIHRSLTFEHAPFHLMIVIPGGHA